MRKRKKVDGGRKRRRKETDRRTNRDTENCIYRVVMSHGCESRTLDTRVRLVTALIVAVRLQATDDCDLRHKL